MTDLKSQELSHRDENIDGLTEILDEDYDTSAESNAEIIVLTICAIIIMGILVVLFI